MESELIYPARPLVRYKVVLVASIRVVAVLAAVVLLIVAAIVLGGFGSSTAKAVSSSDGKINIGSILILSGDGASWGEASRNGLLMAQDDLNARGGVLGRNISVSFQDDHGDPEQAVNAFNELTAAQGINIIIGTTWSRTGLAVAPLASAQRVLMISPSLGLAEFNEQSRYLFNTWPHDELLSSQLADYVYAQGHRSVALVSTKDVWVQEQTAAFTQRFTELGGTVVVTVEPLTDATDVSSDASKVMQAIRSQNTTAVVYTTDGIRVGALVAKKLKELGSDKPQYAITIDAAVIASSQGGYDGTYMLTFLTPSSGFTKRYHDRFKKEPDIGGDSAYDALMLVAQAMNATQSQDPTVLADYLNNIRAYDGVSGHLTADGKRAFTKPFAVMQITNNTAVPVTLPA